MNTLHAVALLLISGRLQRRDANYPTAFSRYAVLDAQHAHCKTWP